MSSASSDGNDPVASGGRWRRRLAACLTAVAGPPAARAVVPWVVLLGLSVALVVGAVTLDARGRSWFIGDEATYAMQAASVAFDGDLAYELHDFTRFTETWGRLPEGLILQTVDRGEHLTFGKPPLYALAVAPLVRLSPTRGAQVANALIFVAALIVAAGSLTRVVGPAAPLWSAAFGFASVVFAYAFWIHADLFLFSLTMLGLALVYRRADYPAVAWLGVRRGAAVAPIAEIYAEIYDGARGELGWQAPPEFASAAGDDEESASAAAAKLERRLQFGRWLAAGMLLGAVGAYRPVYLGLLLPGFLAARWEGREGAGRLGRPWIAFGLGALLIFFASTAVQLAAGGDWTAYGGERQGFYPATGYPLVDLDAAGWQREVADRGNPSWLQEGYLSTKQGLALWLRNGLYLMVGRNVGLLPYAAPLLLGFAAFSGRRGRYALLLALLLTAVALVAIRPFNFYGGAGAIANRYMVPVLPAFLFLAGRPLGRRAAWAWPLVVTLIAAPFLYRLWQSPRQYPVDASGRYAHVTAVATRYLPYETSQSHIPGGRDVAHRGVWVKSLSDGVGPVAEGVRFELFGGADGDLLIGSPRPLRGLSLAFGTAASAELTVRGATVSETVLRADGGVSFQLDLDPPHTVHPMWWTWDPYYLYLVKLRMGTNPVPVPFTIDPL